MRELEKEFEGVGSMRGFSFRQYRYFAGVYIYELRHGEGEDMRISYEVFERRVRGAVSREINGKMIDFEASVRYPSSSAFGDWAYSCGSLERAEFFFTKLVERVRLRSLQRL